MNGIKQALNRIAYWTMPPGLFDLFRRLKDIRSYADRKTLRSNARYRNLYSGRRCFILCNGPSVAAQDLTLLKNEIVFSVSSGYLHKQYDAIRPRYHCSPPLCYTQTWTEDVAIAYLREMDERTGDAELFLSITEKKLIEKKGLFAGRKISYLSSSHLSSFRHQDRIVDLTKTIPGVQSVPIMCLMIAMYMGFSKIFLLGTDHDLITKNKYCYPYELSAIRGKIEILADDGSVTFSNSAMFKSYVLLWEQYEAIRKIASASHIAVYNATNGGILDEFPRVKFETIFSVHQ
jgi:hypothetical protein